MRILFATYPWGFQFFGGAEVQILRTKQALEQRHGHSVTLFNYWEHKFVDYDILHVFGMLSPELWYLSGAARRFGVKVAVSTIYWPVLPHLLRHPFSSRKLRIGQILRYHLQRTIPLFGETLHLVRTADVLLPNSQAEAEILRREFGANPERISVVPNAVDESFEPGDPSLFADRFGVKDFVLCVGRIEDRKNQHRLIQALRGTGIPIVLAGLYTEGDRYYQYCRSFAGPEVIFTGAIPHADPLLLSAFAACRVFVLPSWFETPGLAALEAARCGAPVVITNGGCTREYFGEEAMYVNPYDERDIRRSVLTAYERGSARAAVLSERVRREYTWGNCARQTHEAYARALGAGA
jgi:glycosyltransferase involved in cell wall biosynthesis